MKSDVLFSKKSDEWATPKSWFEYLNLEFGFTLDACANEQNAKCERFFDKIDDGLNKDWTEEGVFMNPPYSEISRWMAKAYQECIYNHALIVCLVPARVDTRWWKSYAEKASEIRFPKGRLKFNDGKNPAPFPCAIVIFRPTVNGVLRSKGGV